MQQEELAYQAHLHKQEMELERKQYEESLAREVVAKEEKIRLLLAQTKKLETQLVSCILEQLVKEEVPKYKFVSFKQSNPLEPSSKFSKIDIPSFRGFHLVQENVVLEQN